MEKDKENKVTEFSKKKTVKHKFYGRDLPLCEGFPYLQMHHDVNGFNFNEKNISQYSSFHRYTITLSKKENNKIVLNNFFVEGDRLCDFFKLYNEGKIEGDIVEIDKFDPEILA